MLRRMARLIKSISSGDELALLNYVAQSNP
jgi:hypothetical protein